MADLDFINLGTDNVAIFVYGLGGGFGIATASADAAVGTVYKIGGTVYNVIVGQKVGFKTDVYFATDDGLTFASVPKDYIMLTYEPV